MKRKLRIAQLVLPWISIPPKTYAGTERIVYYLTEGLVKEGHEVTLFSVGESKTSAKLEFIIEKAMGLQNKVMDVLKSSFYPIMHVSNCFEHQDQFDIIHSHAQFLGLLFAAISKTPSLHTFHRVYEFEKEDEQELVNRYSNLNFNSISNSQRVPGINYIATVYNGVDINKFKPSINPKRDYLFWAGRIIEKKGPREAIAVSKALKMPLILAGKITNMDYFKKYIEKELDGKNIKFVGEIHFEEMLRFYQNAKATLVPAKWNEPFGLVPAESLACGTPVVAYDGGALKEIIKHKKVGFLAKEKEGVEGLIKHVKNIDSISPEDCRQHIIDNFTIDLMVENYEKVYYKLLGEKN